ncbi:RNA exonuclease 4 [Orchesella cincta]|uniref:RNA exonuclease 4 n=1 Tax=Orchesella cincta TaxID=48709 RepID=A0A1D2NK74_ORCCI|nr:RNA exonuclease 4 [Orchesella cincta]
MIPSSSKKPQVVLKHKSPRQPQASKSQQNSNTRIKPVAKIPSSRQDSSSNWRALLQSQGKSVKEPPPSTQSNEAPKASVSKNASSSTAAVTVAKDTKRFRNSASVESRSDAGDRPRSLSQTRSHSKLSMASASETASSVGTDNFETESEADTSIAQQDQSQRVKQEFRALGLSNSKASQRPSRTAERAAKFAANAIRKIPGVGLNEFGFFDYSHYGVLRTPIIPAHEEFMTDTGIIAMDCEMVGVGPMKESALARVSIVNEYGFCLYDKFVKPKMEVTDYRTQYSGIRENDLKNATPFQIVAKEVASLLKSHILVGHSLKSDLAVLYLSHPKARTRDTAMYFKKILHTKTPKLKTLVKKILEVEIQQGEHNSIVDAQATMALYRLCQKDWEIQVRQSNRGINILKQALDELRELNEACAAEAQKSVATQVPPPRVIPWYETEENVPIYMNHVPASVPPQALNSFPMENYVPCYNNVPINMPIYPVSQPIPVPSVPHYNAFNTMPVQPTPYPNHNFGPSRTYMLHPHIQAHPHHQLPTFMEPPMIFPVYPIPYYPMPYVHM